MFDETSMRLAVLADHLDEVDYYALLEVARDAPRDDVRDAFHRFALRFHPDQHLGDALEHPRALAIFKRGAEAYRVLLSPVLRARYDAVVAAGGTRLPVDAMQPGVDAGPRALLPPAARPFYDKALESLERGDLGGARLHLALAAARGESPAFDALAERIDAAARGPR